MSGDEDSTIEELKQRQLDHERAERERLAESVNQADADSHLRRADKAHYLRSKLEQRERSERDPPT